MLTLQFCRFAVFCYASTFCLFTDFVCYLLICYCLLCQHFCLFAIVCSASIFSLFAVGLCAWTFPCLQYHFACIFVSLQLLAVLALSIVLQLCMHYLQFSMFWTFVVSGQLPTVLLSLFWQCMLPFSHLLGQIYLDMIYPSF